MGLNTIIIILAYVHFFYGAYTCGASLSLSIVCVRSLLILVGIIVLEVDLTNFRTIIKKLTTILYVVVPVSILLVDELITHDLFGLGSFQITFYKFVCLYLFIACLFVIHLVRINKRYEVKRVEREIYAITPAA